MSPQKPVEEVHLDSHHSNEKKAEARKESSPTGPSASSSIQPKQQPANLMKGVSNEKKVNNVKMGLLKMIDPDIEIKRK